MKSPGQLLTQWIEKRFDGNQAAAADYLGISHAYISYLKDDARAPGRGLAIRIQDETGISVTAWPLPGLSKTKKRRAGRRAVAQSTQGVNANG
jgi:plasmid maintenance system antidote protein VapI